MHLLILLGLMFGTALAVSNSETRIVGGSDTTIEEYPFMVQMQYLWFDVWWTTTCGGSLLTTSVILSAATCYGNDSPSLWRGLVGATKTNYDGDDLPAEKITIHPDFDSTTAEYNFAIIRSSVRAVLSERVGFASIPAASYNLPDGSAVKAVGWGATTYEGIYAEQLQHVEMNTINQEVCAARYNELRAQAGFGDWPEVTPKMICSGVLDVGGRDACTGDSGGPIIHGNNVVVGVISWGYDCGHSFYPGVSSRVSTVPDWIIQNVLY